MAVLCEMSGAMREAFLGDQMVVPVRQEEICILRLEREKTWLMMIRALVAVRWFEIQNCQEPAIFQNAVCFRDSPVHLMSIN